MSAQFPMDYLPESLVPAKVWQMQERLEAMLQTIESLVELVGDGSGGSSKLASPGDVRFRSSIVVPIGWLECNGVELSRITYANLWAVAQESGMLATSAAQWAANPGMYYIGNGATTFNIPDYRGTFFRAWDHGRGVDSNRALGSYQGHQLEDHTHYVPSRSSGAGTQTGDGYLYGTSFGGGTSYPNSGSHGSETRTRNDALLVIIKY
jgi:microcystin-dependent protein